MYHDLPFSGVIIGEMHCIQIVLIFTAEMSKCVIGLFLFPLYFAAAGLVLNWNQANGVLHASGDVRVIRLWDTHKEMRILVRHC